MAVTLLIVTIRTFVDKNLLILTASLFSGKKRSRFVEGIRAVGRGTSSGIVQAGAVRSPGSNDPGNVDDFCRVITCGRLDGRH